MREVVQHTDLKSTVFTEDLKNLVHLANEDDLNLVKEMTVKFVSQNKELRFGSFVFGPVVMRMYHFLNKPNEALEAFKDPALGEFFDQLVSIQILMDLLFENAMYDKVIEVFEIVKDKQLQGSKYPKNAVTLAFAALYKQNTPAANEYSKTLWAELNSIGHYPMRRSATFAAALAINQGDPAVALEILTSVRRQTYVTVRNLKIKALAELGRPDDALPVLRNILEANDSGREVSHTISKESIDTLEASIKKLNNPEVTAEFESILKSIKDLRLFDTSPLDEQLCSVIEGLTPRQGNEPFDRYNRQGQNRRPSYYQKRPGVMSMV